MASTFCSFIFNYDPISGIDAIYYYYYCSVNIIGPYSISSSIAKIRKITIFKYFGHFFFERNSLGLAIKSSLTVITIITSQKV
jgi:hypothetical protein